LITSVACKTAMRLGAIRNGILQYAAIANSATRSLEAHARRLAESVAQFRLTGP
jgi:hypothetical protein